MWRCYSSVHHISKRNLLKLQIQMLQYNGNNSDQYGHDEQTLVKKKEQFNWTKWPPGITDASTELTVPSEEMLADMNTALLTILNASITETSELIYVSATIILETLGYKIKHWSRMPHVENKAERQNHWSLKGC